MYSQTRRTTLQLFAAATLLTSLSALPALPALGAEADANGIFNPVIKKLAAGE